MPKRRHDSVLIMFHVIGTNHKVTVIWHSVTLTYFCTIMRVRPFFVTKERKLKVENMVFQDMTPCWYVDRY